VSRTANRKIFRAHDLSSHLLRGCIVLAVGVVVGGSCGRRPQSPWDPVGDSLPGDADAQHPDEDSPSTDAGATGDSADIQSDEDAADTSAGDEYYAQDGVEAQADRDGENAAGDLDDLGDAASDADSLTDATIRINRGVFLTPGPSSSPIPLATASEVCVENTVGFLLEGPERDPWVFTAIDAAGSPLPSVPASGPGELVPEYLGGGVYSEVGYATVYGYELPPEAAMIIIDIGGEQWVIANTCSGLLLNGWLYETGLAGVGTAIDAGAVTCPQPAPWTLALEAPAGSSYQVLIFDFDSGDIVEHDEVSLPQNSDGLVVLPSLPAWGRVQLNLLDANGQEVETLAIYLEC
jgi:hypothetical protein